MSYVAKLETVHTIVLVSFLHKNGANISLQQYILLIGPLKVDQCDMKVDVK